MFCVADFVFCLFFFPLLSDFFVGACKLFRSLKTLVANYDILLAAVVHSSLLRPSLAHMTAPDGSGGELVVALAGHLEDIAHTVRLSFRCFVLALAVLTISHHCTFETVIEVSFPR